jgi:hypothetical protein
MNEKLKPNLTRTLSIIDSRVIIGYNSMFKK